MKIDPKAVTGIAGKFFSEMDKAISKTREEGVEYGFALCKGKEGVYITKPERGGRYYIAKMAKCEVGDKEIGDFHTHPRGIDKFSCGDIAHAISKGLDVTCIGYSKKISIIKDGEEKYYENCVKCAVIDQDASRRAKYGRLFSRLHRIEHKISDVIYNRPKDYERYRDIHVKLWNVSEKLFSVAEKNKFIRYKEPIDGAFGESRRIVGEKAI